MHGSMSSDTRHYVDNGSSGVLYIKIEFDDNNLAPTGHSVRQFNKVRINSIS